MILGKTPQVLRYMGLKQLPLATKGSVVDKMFYEHGLTRKQIKALPQAIADPVMVFETKSHSDSFVVVLDMYKDGDIPIVVALQPDRKVDRYVINHISSAYGMDKVGVIEKWAKSGLLRYINQQKSPVWSTTVRLQLPWVVHSKQGSDRKLSTNKDIVKSPLYFAIKAKYSRQTPSMP